MQDELNAEGLSTLSHRSRVMYLASCATEVARKYRKGRISKEIMESEIRRYTDLLRACHDEHEIAEAEENFVDEVRMIHHHMLMSNKELAEDINPKIKVDIDEEDPIRAKFERNRVAQDFRENL